MTAELYLFGAKGTTYSNTPPHLDLSAPFLLDDLPAAAGTGVGLFLHAPPILADVAAASCFQTEGGEGG